MSDWRAQAACVGHNPEKWFPNTGEKRARDEARRICQSCPVRTQCQQFAQTETPEYGIWAGRTWTHTNGGRYITASPAVVKQPCGTMAAYRRHYRHGETPCTACFQARYQDDVERAERQAAQ